MRNKKNSSSRKNDIKLQDLASRTLLFCLQRSSRGRLKHFANSVLGLGRTLEIRKRIYLVSHCSAFLDTHRLLFHLHQFAFGGLVIPQVTLVADKDYRHIRAEVLHLRRPLLRNVFEAVGTVDGKAHENYIRVWIRKRSQPIIVFLACCVPQCQLNLKVSTRHLSCGQLITI